MAEHAEELLAAEARAVSATRSAHDTVAGPLVVGTWGSTAATLLAPIVQRMSVAFPEVSISSREVDLDAATTSVRYGEVDVAFGLDYRDAPMPGDKAIQLVRLPPEEFASRSRPAPSAARDRAPCPGRRSTSGPSCSASSTGSCPRRPPSTVAPSARDSGAWASSRGWCTR